MNNENLMMYDYTKKAAYIVTANKALVDWLLSLNSHNRPIKKTQINSLKYDIKNSNWHLTNQGIGITKTGWITDGQNRLIAIRELNYPACEFVLLTGLEEMAQAVVDKHARRRQIDQISLLLDVSVSSQAISAMNCLLKISHNGERFIIENKRTSEFDLADYYVSNNEIVNSIILATGKQRASVCAALIDFAVRYNLSSAVQFASDIKTGTNLSSTDPAYRLREYINKTKGSGASGTVQLDSYVLTVSACISYALGKPIGKLRPATSWEGLRACAQ